MGGRGASSSSINRAYDGKIQLQSVGQVDARKVSNLKVGDIDIEKIMEIYDEIIIEGDKIICKK